MDAHRVVGRDGAVQERPARSARVLGPQARERLALLPVVQDAVLQRGQIRDRLDGPEGVVGGHRPKSSPRPLCARPGLSRLKPYHPPDAAPAAAVVGHALPVRGRVPVLPLPRARPGLRRLPPAGGGPRRPTRPRHRPGRRHARQQAQPRLADRPVREHRRADRAARAERPAAALPLRRDRRRVPPGPRSRCSCSPASGRRAGERTCGPSGCSACWPCWSSRPSSTSAWRATTWSPSRASTT